MQEGQKNSVREFTLKDKIFEPESNPIKEIHL